MAIDALVLVWKFVVTFCRSTITLSAIEALNHVGWLSYQDKSFGRRGRYANVLQHRLFYAHNKNKKAKLMLGFIC